MAQTLSAIAPCICLLVYLVTIQGVFKVESAELFPPREARRVNEKEMLVELQDVLEKLQSKRVLSWESKLNQVAKCTLGDVCAVKRGARVGKLCDCPRRSNCNYYFLKCL
ncbi:cocaine- and amphetamine-regulated transcript protein-like [Xenopus laevis]|uniref:Cocaine- and amphetamine-regulated transcript protein-like n=1 Tax=Xenopus laevis TaxID=8355 RepID=A0A8J1LLY9_XENLA|nr:cocaine- and amphetamine-regulated transcript protein-like [Xenopus laevis]